MSTQEAILSALQAMTEKEGALLDPKVGRAFHLSLQKSLGGQVTDQTAYTSGRAYQFDCPQLTEEERPWRSVLRLYISGAGPFASHSFIQQSSQHRWWSGAIRVNRKGFDENDEQLAAKLRAWYQENNLTEVDQQVLAQPVPPSIPLRRGRYGDLNLFDGLFKS